MSTNMGILLDKLKESAISEIKRPRLESTIQLLEKIPIELNSNGEPIVTHIDTDNNSTESHIYFKAKSCNFYIDVTINHTNNFEILSTETISGIDFSLTFQSDSISLNDLLGMTKLPSTEHVEKGNTKRIGKHSFISDWNSITIESHSNPAPFEKKLIAFLTLLETDKQGVQALVKATGCKSIMSNICYHIGNHNLTELHLSSDIIQRLNSLGLEITFDLYAEGKPF